jgi:hypothetical protein
MGASSSSGAWTAPMSPAQITVAEARRVLRLGTLPLAQHDAQGAVLNGLVYVFGGGAAPSSITSSASTRLPTW